MALLTVTYLGATVAINAGQVIESVRLLLRRRQPTIHNAFFGIFEYVWGMFSLWEVISPTSTGTRIVAFAFLGYLVLGLVFGLYLNYSQALLVMSGQRLPRFPLWGVYFVLVYTTSLLCLSLYEAAA